MSTSLPSTTTPTLMSSPPRGTVVDARRDELDRIALANTTEASGLVGEGLANLNGGDGEP